MGSSQGGEFTATTSDCIDLALQRLDLLLDGDDSAELGCR